MPAGSRRRFGPAAAIAGLAVTAAGLGAKPAAAQYVPDYFPVGVPGYNQELGVNVVTRVHPLYEQPGIRAGSFIIRPNLDESLGYNSNVAGIRGAPGSMVIETHPSIAINSDWTRNALGASFSADNYQFPNASSQNRTDWTAALGGGYTIGRSDLTLAYSHLQLHETASDIGAPPATTPIPFTVDDFRVAYTFDLGRLKITPNFEYSMYRYGSGTILGLPADQSFRDANIAQGGAAFRYELSEQRSLLLVLQGINSNFIHTQPNSPSLSSTSGLLLGGIDYQYNGVWRYQLLAGFEVRSFAASEFGTEVQPVVKGTAIWTPTGLTTVTGTVLRTIAQPSEAGSAGYNYTSTELRVDHELRRNVLLNGEAGARFAQYLQAGTQSQYYASAGASWLMNRNMRLTGQYTFTNQHGPGSAFAFAPFGEGINSLTNSGSFNQSVFLLTLHVGL